MPRGTMAALITQVRTLIGDPADANSQFDDDTLQGWLDSHRTDGIVAGIPQLSFSGGGVIQYLAYKAPIGDWESGWTIQSGQWATLTPASLDYQQGRVTFSTSQLPPVWFTGATYDVYGAAADALDAWAGASARKVDFTDDQQSVKLSQQATALRGQAAHYRSLARGGGSETGMMYRGDIKPRATDPFQSPFRSDKAAPG